MRPIADNGMVGVHIVGEVWYLRLPCSICCGFVVSLLDGKATTYRTSEVWAIVLNFIVPMGLLGVYSCLRMAGVQQSGTLCLRIWAIPSLCQTSFYDAKSAPVCLGVALRFVDNAWLRTFYEIPRHLVTWLLIARCLDGELCKQYTSTLNTFLYSWNIAEHHAILAHSWFWKKYPLNFGHQVTYLKWMTLHVHASCLLHAFTVVSHNLCVGWLKMHGLKMTDHRNPWA